MCSFDRRLLDAYLDGETPPGEPGITAEHYGSCPECRGAARRSALAVAVFLAAPVSTEPASWRAPAGFADAVMDRIRREAGTAPRRTHEDDRAPRTPPREPVREPVRPGRPVRLAPRPTIWIAAGSLAAGAALFFILNTNSGENRSPDVGRRLAKVETIDGRGLQRWSRRADGTDSGVWIRAEEEFPPGASLHVPASSSAYLRLSGGARVDAGPCWLAVGTDGVSVLDGSVRATVSQSRASSSGGGGEVFVEAPGVAARAPGEVEVRVVTPGGTRVRGWLYDRASALAAGARASGPAAASVPGAAVLVTAVRGAVTVDLRGGGGGGGTDEGRRTLAAGESLAVVDGRAFLVRRGGEGAPDWVRGMPAPPAPPAAGGTPAPPAPPPLASGGPVRNSLERVLSDAGAGEEARREALHDLGELGGLAAIAAGERGAEDPSPMVRVTAVRVLALNYAEAPARAAAALRALADDPDVEVAVAALKALRYLEDPAAVELFRRLVQQDGKPIEVRVQAARALPLPSAAELVEAVAAVAALAPEGTRLEEVAQSAAVAAVAGSSPERGRALLAHENPGVRAAALRMRGTADGARRALSDPSDLVRGTAAARLLVLQRAEAFPALEVLAGDVRRVKRVFLPVAVNILEADPDSVPPVWLSRVASEVASDPREPMTARGAATWIVARAGLSEVVDRFFDEPELAVEALESGRCTPAQVLRGLRSPDGIVRTRALRGLRDAAQTGAPLSSELVTAAIAVSPVGAEESVTKAEALSRHAQRDDETAMAALLAMARSPDAAQRRGFALAGRLLADRLAVADALTSLLGDPDSEVVAAAARSVVASNKTGWAGPSAASFAAARYASPVANAAGAVVARRGGAAGAEEAFLAALSEATSRERVLILQEVLRFDPWALLAMPREVLEDADPAVRLLAFRALGPAARREAALVLRDDPARWVRAAALGVLAEDGDAAAATALSETVEGIRKGGGRSATLALGLPQDPAGLLRALDSRLGMALQAGLVREQMSADPRLMASLSRLDAVSRTARAAATLASGPDTAAHVAAAEVLGDLPVREALAPLVRAAGLAGEADRPVARAAARALEALIEYAPKDTWNDWHRRNKAGFVSPLEIGVHGGHR